MKLINLLLERIGFTFIITIWWAFFFLLPISVLAEELSFQDEFNINRAPNTLDLSKWDVFSNTNTNFSTIQEANGFVLLRQQDGTKQFPFVRSKNQILPAGDFTFKVSFQFPRVTFAGVGLSISENQLANGPVPPEMFSISVFQGRSPNPVVNAMNIYYKDQIVHTIPINTALHTLQVDHIGNRYLIYLDNTLVFTSPETSEQVRFFWVGNPTTQLASISDWSRIQVDSIQVKSTAPQAFLRLPWDYESKHVSFNEAAQAAIFSYFDHQYPLLSAGKVLSEPVENISDTISFRNINSSNIGYSKHDGFDYSHETLIKQGDTVVAAANGAATYTYDDEFIGNAIFVDHGNGYQTRYYHLESQGLITKGPKVQVIKGQKIGQVGSTGNSTGPHLHFMVVQDKNKDGNFDDNIPDGIVDPYGWQSSSPDPWEVYSFFYNGRQRTGNKSYYLWDKRLDNLEATLTSNGGVFNTERFELKFPQNFTEQNLNLHIEAAPIVKTQNSLESIGSVIEIWLKDSFGNEFSQYKALYELIIDYQAYDLTRFKPETVAIYSSKDGLDWFREDTQIDFLNKKASAKLNHMTYFALMGDPIDKLPPTTEASLEGLQGVNGWYRSTVKVQLQAQDNENGFGVENTYYKIQGQEWELYSQPLLFDNEGHYRIEFYSVDRELNSELPRSLEFSIDKIHPEAKIFVNQTLLDLQIEGIDMQVTTVTSQPLNSNNLKQYSIQDLAGNSVNLVVEYKDREKRDDFQIKQISYNGQTPLLVGSNNLRFSYQVSNNLLKVAKQSFDSEDLKKKANVSLEYDFLRNESKIIEIIGDQTLNQTQQGFKLLQVQTNSGTLDYNY